MGPFVGVALDVPYNPNRLSLYPYDYRSQFFTPKFMYDAFEYLLTIMSNNTSFLKDRENMKQERYAFNSLM